MGPLGQPASQARGEDDEEDELSERTPLPGAAQAQPMSAYAPEERKLKAQAQEGLGHAISRFAVGAIGVGGIALLAVGSLTPLIAAFASESLTVPALAGWLGGLGSNAVANWVDEWSRKAVNYAISDDELLEERSRDLQRQIADKDALAQGIATLLERTDAITMALNTLRGQGEAQTRLVDEFRQDLNTFKNQRLRDLASQALSVQSA